MFDGCSRLNYIKAMFTTTPSTNYTIGWVRGVASSGIFVKNRAATWDVTGENGIPSNWTVPTKGIIAIYIDDFPEKIIDPNENDEFNNDMHEFKQYYLDTYDELCNRYVWYGETVEYNSQTMYLFELEDDCDNIKYLLTTTADYNTLYNESLDSNLDNEFTSLVGRFNEDLEIYDDGQGGPGNQQYLVMVEQL